MFVKPIIFLQSFQMNTSEILEKYDALKWLVLLPLAKVVTNSGFQ